MPAGWRGERRRWRSMASGEELAGVARPAATVHRLPIRKNWEKEESEASLIRGKTWPGKWLAC